MSGLAEELLKLRFVPGPLQSLYLNQDRVAERFTSHLGAISEWTRRSEGEGGVGVDIKVVKADVRMGGGNEVSYDLHDITIRALLLRGALQAADVIRSPEEASVGDRKKPVTCFNDRHRPPCPWMVRIRSPLGVKYWHN